MQNIVIPYLAFRFLSGQRDLLLLSKCPTLLHVVSRHPVIIVSFLLFYSERRNISGEIAGSLLHLKPGSWTVNLGRGVEGVGGAEVKTEV